MSVSDASLPPSIRPEVRARRLLRHVRGPEEGGPARRVGAARPLAARRATLGHHHGVSGKRIGKGLEHRHNLGFIRLG